MCKANTVPHTGEADRPQRPAARKKPYQSPALISYGALRTLTQSGSGTGTESGPNKQGKCGGAPRFPCI